MNLILGEHKLNKIFINLPYIRLWPLCVVTTPFRLHYTELTKAYKLHLLLEQLTKPWHSLQLKLAEPYF